MNWSCWKSLKNALIWLWKMWLIYYTGDLHLKYAAIHLSCFINVFYCSCYRRLKKGLITSTVFECCKTTEVNIFYWYCNLLQQVFPSMYCYIVIFQQVEVQQTTHVVCSNTLSCKLTAGPAEIQCELWSEYCLPTISSLIHRLLNYPP